MAPIDPFQPVVLRHPRLPLEAHIIPLGANPTRIIYTNPSTGEQNDMIVGPEDPRDHWEKGRKFLGPIIGRYGNRLPAGHVKFSGGEMYIPEFSAPGVSLHGGPEVVKELPIVEEGTLPPQAGPLDRLIFTQIQSTESQFYNISNSSQENGSSESSTILAAISKGVETGQQGYPGTVRIEVQFTLEPGQHQQRDLPAVAGRSAGSLRMEYRAGLVEDGSGVEATPLNITHHWAFNLSASDFKAREEEEGTIDHHLLRMWPTPGVEPPKGALGRPDGQHLWTPELDEKMVPTGNLIVCEPEGPHDFLHPGENGQGRTLKHSASPSNMYDHFYVWGKAPKDDAQQSQEQISGNPRLLFTAPSTGLSLAFDTNQAGVQVYATTGLPPKPSPADATSGGAKKILHGGKGKTGNHLRSGVCLEFGAPHATLLHEQYQHLAQGDTILRKDEQYRSFVQLELFVQ